MDIDRGPLQASTLGSSPAFGVPKVGNVQLSGGLARYHSAPSSVLASLLDDDFVPASDDSDFAKLLNEGIRSFSPLLETKSSQLSNMPPPVLPVIPKEEGVYVHTSTVKDTHKKYFVSGGSKLHEPLSQIRLSSISEHPVEETAETDPRNQVSMSTGFPQHQFHGRRAVSSPGHSARTLELPVTLLPQYNGGFIRQSSPPPDNLSRAAMDDTSDEIKPGAGCPGRHLASAEEKLGSQKFLSSTQVASINTFSEVQRLTTSKQVSSLKKSTPLLRQSSSPAGLLSQVNLEDLTTDGVSPSTAFLDRRGMMSGKSHVIGTWADGMPELAMQHLAALHQRKRGRVIEEKLSLDMQQGNGELANVLLGDFTGASYSIAGNRESLEGYSEDTVLCKARAKRGCATHPRSIAERQRRIKISERMKKLQDLVPNVDKQASTAEMLDEVVEYVKLLQRQVQDLLLNPPRCTGECQQKGKSPP